MTERIATPKNTRQIIEENRFAFKKNYGQNFLIDNNILDTIVDAAKITKDDHVLEIGPGIGSLTQVLAESAKKVVAVEIDKMLIPILQNTLSPYENVSIIHRDILKTDVMQLLADEELQTPIKVIANLPYYITTPIIMDLLEKHYPIDSITVMVQKEVAERMEALPGTKNYGALSVAVQYYCNVNLDTIVSPSCFMPPPKISSAVITLKVLPERGVATKDEALFFHVVKCAFGQRRKTLLNSLFNQGEFGLSKEELTILIESLGWDARIRGEKLSIVEFARFTDVLYEVLH
ncbi:MAG: 16S rRNA (adenine(1518)-N(6)/adenine(1519)-N(6))-dimethyltransferase RsmA [Bacillota bacterium]